MSRDFDKTAKPALEAPVTRRQALRMLGLAGLAGYVAPIALTVSDAAAKDGGGGGDGGGSGGGSGGSGSGSGGGSGSGSGGSGSGSGGGSSGSGSGGSGSGSGGGSGSGSGGGSGSGSGGSRGRGRGKGGGKGRGRGKGHGRGKSRGRSHGKRSRGRGRARGRGRGMRGVDHRRAREAVARGQSRPLNEIYRAVYAAVPGGSIVRTRLRWNRSRLYYSVRIIDFFGVMHGLTVDARTARIVSKRRA